MYAYVYILSEFACLHVGCVCTEQRSGWTKGLVAFDSDKLEY